MNKKLVLLGATLLMTAATASAQKRVTGRVVDAAGEPVIGASVRVQGGKGVAVTDENGNFTLANVPASAKHLKVTYIGKEEKTVSISSNVRVVLSDNDKVLDEAVVVGYGTARKVGTVVGSVTKVGSEQISDNPVTSIADAMQGQVAGLQVFNNTGDVGDLTDVPSFYIRGIGSLEAGNTPLIVVDGSPVGASVLNLMNDRDIESITTLKDASATSIYGSRAANGVIYITTKKGRRDQKAQVIVGQKIGWSQLAREIGNPMNASELLEFQLENGIITASDYLKYKKHGANTNWQDYYFDDAAPMYQTDFSVRGGSQNNSYFVSASYLKNQGVDGLSHMKRFNVRANMESRVNDWMSLGFNQNIVYTDRNMNGYTRVGSNNLRSFSTAAQMFPAYWDPYDPESAANHMIWGKNSYESAYVLSLQPRTINDILYNGSAYISLTPVKGLTVKSQLGLYALNTNSRSRTLTEFGELAEGSATASASASDSRSAQWTITNTAEYRFNIGEDHEITLLAGQEGIRYTSNGFSASAKGSSDNRLPLLSNMTVPNKPEEEAAEYQFLSFFGRADYSLMNRYFFNLTVRNDQSSRFGSKNRSATFYSGGAMWNLRAENFMENLWWIDALDLRFSVGSTGNSSIGNYMSLGLIGSTAYGGASGWGLSQPANEELGWETQIQTNLGFTARFLNKLTVDFNVYKRKTKDMLMEVPLPYTTGFSKQMMNVGEMTNKGVEIAVSYDVLKTRDYYLSVRANYAYNTNQIDKLFYGKDVWPMEANLLCYKVGESLNYYMPIYAGVDKNDGAPMWYLPGHKGDVQHEFDPETMTKDASNMDALNQDTGKNMYAPHTGGFGFTAGWKGFTLNADFAFVLGKYLVNNTYLWTTQATSGYNLTRDMLNSWRNPGDITDMPGIQYDHQFDTHVLENASFMRLKNLTLAYDLPKSLLHSTFVEGVRISATGRNLFTVTKFKGTDPEIDTNIAYGNYPATRQFVLGLEVTF